MSATAVRKGTIMAHSDKVKQSLYFPDDVLRDIMDEAIRLDRSISWMVQHAWRIARAEIGTFPAAVRPPAAQSDWRSTERPENERRPESERKLDRDRAASERQLRDFLKGKFDRELAGRDSSPLDV